MSSADSKSPEESIQLRQFIQRPIAQLLLRRLRPGIDNPFNGYRLFRSKVRSMVGCVVRLEIGPQRKIPPGEQEERDGNKEWITAFQKYGAKSYGQKRVNIT